MFNGSPCKFIQALKKCVIPKLIPVSNKSTFFIIYKNIQINGEVVVVSKNDFRYTCLSPYKRRIQRRRTALSRETTRGCVRSAHFLSIFWMFKHCCSFPNSFLTHC